MQWDLLSHWVSEDTNVKCFLWRFQFYTHSLVCLIQMNKELQHWRNKIAPSTETQSSSTERKKKLDRHSTLVCMHFSVCECICECEFLYAPCVSPCVRPASYSKWHFKPFSCHSAAQRHSVDDQPPPWGFWYDPLELCLLIRVLPCPVGRGGWQDKWLS